jgi:hypothetical protein
MIPHFIDLLCRGISLAALIWGVFSMGFMSAERKASVSQSENDGPASGSMASIPLYEEGCRSATGCVGNAPGAQQTETSAGNLASIPLYEEGCRQATGCVGNAPGGQQTETSTGNLASIPLYEEGCRQATGCVGNAPGGQQAETVVSHRPNNSEVEPARTHSRFGHHG